MAGTSRSVFLHKQLIDSMFRLSIILVCAVLSTEYAVACGSDFKTFSVIFNHANTKDEMYRNLGSVVGCTTPIDNSSTADEMIFRTLLKARKLGVGNAQLVSVFLRYRCVYSLRRRKLYQEFREMVGVENFGEACNIEELSRFFTVIPRRGVTVRKGPSTSSDRIFVLAQDELVEVTGEAGDWFKVSHMDRIGYIRGDLIGLY